MTLKTKKPTKTELLLDRLVEKQTNSRQEIKELKDQIKELKDQTVQINKKISPLTKRINLIQPHIVERYLKENTKRVKVVKDRFEVMLTKIIVATELNWLYGKDKLDKDHAILLAAIMHAYDFSDDWWLERTGSELRDWKRVIMEEYTRKIQKGNNIMSILG
jgi:chromosome segregation ATPase